MDCLQVDRHAVFSNALAYFATSVSYTLKMFMKFTPGVCIVKHYAFVIYRLRRKLVFLFVKASVFVQTRIKLTTKIAIFPLITDIYCFIVQVPGACIIKLNTTVIYSVTYKASVFVQASKKLLTIAKALSYGTTELIMAIKNFMIQVPEAVFLFVCNPSMNEL